MPTTKYESGGRELDWDDIIGNKDELVIIEKGWVEGKDVSEPKEWNPVSQLVKYLEILLKRLKM